MIVLVVAVGVALLAAIIVGVVVLTGPHGSKATMIRRSFPGLSRSGQRKLLAAIRKVEVLEDPNGRVLRRFISVDRHLVLREFTIETPSGSAWLKDATMVPARVGFTRRTITTQSTRPTLTRTVAGGLVLGPAGAVVAGLGAQKTKTKKRTTGSSGHMTITVCAPGIDWSKRADMGRAICRRFDSAKAKATTLAEGRPAEIARARELLRTMAIRVAEVEADEVDAQIVLLVAQPLSPRPTEKVDLAAAASMDEPASSDRTAASNTSSGPAKNIADTASRLRELSRLHDDGLLTDEEFKLKRNSIVEDL